VCSLAIDAWLAGTASPVFHSFSLHVFGKELKIEMVNSTFKRRRYPSPVSVNRAVAGRVYLVLPTGLHCADAIFHWPELCRNTTVVASW
jgi:hypothetical protein